MSHRAPESSPLAQHGAGWGGGRRQSGSQTGEETGLWKLVLALLWPLALSLFLEMHFTFFKPIFPP